MQGSSGYVKPTIMYLFTYQQLLKSSQSCVPVLDSLLAVTGRGNKKFSLQTTEGTYVRKGLPVYFFFNCVYSKYVCARYVLCVTGYRQKNIPNLVLTKNKNPQLFVSAFFRSTTNKTYDKKYIFPANIITNFIDGRVRLVSLVCLVQIIRLQTENFCLFLRQQTDKRLTRKTENRFCFPWSENDQR